MRQDGGIRARFFLQDDLLEVVLENLLPLFQGGQVYEDVAVESPWSEEGLVQDFLSVRRGEDDDTVRGGDAVHLHQELVQGLIGFAGSASRVAAHLWGSFLADGVDFVDVYDTRSSGKILSMCMVVFYFFL